TAGFLVVFLVAGGVLALGGRALTHLFPWLAILVGLGLVALGGWTLLTGRTLELPGLGRLTTTLTTLTPLTHRLGNWRARATGLVATGASIPAVESTALTETTAQRSVQGEVAAAWVFGLGYGLSSLGCTLPVFLLVVGTAATAGGVGGTALVLAAYAVGM